MSLNALYNDILCAFSNDHIVKEPFILACSHVFCKTCLPKASDWVQCKICGSELKINANENIFMKSLNQKNFQESFYKLQMQMSKEFRKLEGNSILIGDS